MPGIRLAALVRRLRRDAAPDAGECADAVLVARFAATRDEAAFELLVRRHGAMVLAVCRRVLGHTEDAEDAFQAAFLVLARKAAYVRRGTAVPAWLHRVAVRIARRAASRRRPASVLISEPPARPAPDAAERSELRGLLDAEIDRLSEPFRRAFVLCYLEGLSNADAARVLGCPVGTIESRLTTARRTLRDRLARRIELPAGVLALLACPPGLSADTVTALSRAAVVAAQRGLRATIGIVREPAVGLAEQGVRAMTKALRMWMGVVLGVSLLGLAAGVGWANRADAPDAEPKIAAEAPTLPPVAPMPKPVDQPAAKGEEWPLAKQLYEVSSGKLFGTTPDGKSLLFQHNNSVGEVSLVGKPLRLRVGAQNQVHAAAISPDGKFSATAEGENGVKLRDATTGEIVEALWPKGDLPALQVAFTSDGAKLIVLCSRDNTNNGGPLAAQKATRLTRVSVWDLTARKELGHPILTDTTEREALPYYMLAGHGRFVLKTQAILEGDTGPRSRRVLKGRRFTTIDAVSGKEGKTIEVSGETIGPIWPDPLSSDGKTLALRDYAQNELRFLDTVSGKDRFPVSAFRRPIKAVAFSPDGRFVAAATGRAGNGNPDTIAAPSEVVIWDAATGKELSRATDKETIRDYSALVFGPDGSFLAAQTNSQGLSITVWGHLPPVEPAPPVPVAKAPDTTPTKPAAKAPDAVAPARFQALIRDLSGAGVTDTRRVEALFLAALGRLPTEVETRTLTAQLGRREDKAAALADLLGTLTETAEFRSHAEELGRMVK
ncbi:sigma-70 family RNA polymerase sigma factor [Frigoriglobus tundricola]|uniref:ECF RNA polymerase sigma factor SigE n=1 Tax=Frigoriglobus tundricola TaxID=2774151 RepID=A0A6M5YI19_9BACT|nr:sigma-70 family RNA polymerase sigma factor [Frigoriglobus tundricola]QJW92971.1 hypothetical protein FTUN_0469 [Frigoriglobus tundricola]